MAHVAFPTDDAEIAALQKEATDPAALKKLAVWVRSLVPPAFQTPAHPQAIKFTQKPVSAQAVVISAQKNLYKLVNMIDSGTKELVTGIFVGFVEAGGVASPVTYVQSTDNTKPKYRIGVPNGVVQFQPNLTSQYDKICKYLELKGYTVFWDRESDPRVKTEPGREQKGYFKSYSIYKQDNLRVVINVVDGGLPFTPASSKQGTVGRAFGRTDFASAVDTERVMRMTQQPATFSYGIVYPNALEHSSIVRHNLGAAKESSAMSNKGTPLNDPKFSDSIQDFVPAISFTQFIKVFKPEDVDNLEKVVSFSSDILLHGRNTLPIKILSTGWTNVVQKPILTTVRPELGTSSPASKEWRRSQETISFEELRYALINFVCSYGITHHKVNGVDIIFYNNKMLSELIKKLEIPSYKMKAEGDTHARADYERYAEFSWHKYAIAKFLLPPYIIESRGDTIFPIESYLHHTYIASRVGAYNDGPAGGTSLDQKKVQSEIRAFISAIKAAANYPDLQPAEVARILNIALGFNI